MQITVVTKRVPTEGAKNCSWTDERIKVDSRLPVTCQFRISAVSVPYQCRPFSAPDVCVNGLI
jgi:hypothetical protein